MVYKRLGFLCKSIEILKDKHRDKIERIQYHMCVCLLCRFDDIARDYKYLKAYVHCADVYAFLGELFNLKREYIIQIIDTLAIYKNVNTLDVGSCLNTKITLKE